MHADSGRIYADEGHEMHRQRRAVTVLSALCQCPLMATETLRGERSCDGAQCAVSVSTDGD